MSNAPDHMQIRHMQIRHMQIRHMQVRHMQISEGELLAMTADLEELHRSRLPVMQEAVAEWTELHRHLRGGAGTATKAAASRRTFILGSGVAVGGLALAACSKTSSSSSTGDTTPGSGASSTTASAGGGGGNQGLTGDLAVAALAASLENTAVATYQAALDAVGGGKLTVPPAVGTFAKTAQMQHKDHAGAWNALLTGAGKQAVSGGDKTVMDGVVTPAFNNVKDVTGLAMLALELENVAAATYLNGIQNVLTNPMAIKTSASIQPVEMQHAAILLYVMGKYPVPDTFAKTDGARTPSDTIG